MIYSLVAADIIMVLAFSLRFRSLPPQLPLIYSKPWGEEQLVDWWLIILLPLLLHLFFFANIYVYNKIFFPDHLIRKVTFILNITVTTICTLIFLKLLFYIT